MCCNSLDEQTILLSLFGNRALYLMASAQPDFFNPYFSLSPTNRSGESQDVHSSEATSLCFLSV